MTSRAAPRFPNVNHDPGTPTAIAVEQWVPIGKALVGPREVVGHHSASAFRSPVMRSSVAIARWHTSHGRLAFFIALFATEPSVGRQRL
ncbi:MAG: hypothetical protein ACRD1T_26285, partial [Acidimicrobiia bacterium]